MGQQNLKQENGKRKLVSILETIDIESGERKVLHEFDTLIEAPNWKKNGKELVYNCLGRIYSYDIGTGVSTPVRAGICVRCNNDHVLSPDQKKIAVSHHTDEDGKSRIYIFPMEGGVPVLITPMGPSYLHGWSPDGSTLAYCAERNGEYDVYTIPVEGGLETRLTDAPGLDDGPEYSPDGKYIWFNLVRSGLMQLWRMRPDGTGQTQITFDEDSNSWFAHLSPDGKNVAYIAYKKGDVAPGDHPANKNVEIRIMPSEGGNYRTLVRLFGGQGTLNVNSWSPCGNKLAFVSYRFEEA
jgi:Tol biopolymer transport system component